MLILDLDSSGNLVFRGDTYPSREQIKSSGATWDSMRKLWHKEYSNNYVEIVKKTFNANLVISRPLEEFIQMQEAQKTEMEQNVKSFIGENLQFLRDYQKQGVFFMTSKTGALLADEQGTGKTATLLGALSWLKNWKSKKEGIGFKALICAPKALTSVWSVEASKFYEGQIELVVVEGKKAQRESIFSTQSDCYVVNYELLSEAPAIRWDAVVSDEIQYVKNRDAKRTNLLNNLQTERRWGCSGTPLENRLEELYSILNWISPGILGDYKKFQYDFVEYEMQQYGRYVFPKFIGIKNKEILREKLRSVSLRRTKIEVMPELPEKQYQTISCELTTMDRHIYSLVREVVLKNLKEFEEEKRQLGEDEDDRKKKPSVPAIAALTSLTFLREVCDDPALLTLSPSKLLWGIHVPPRAGLSPKMEALVELLRECEGQKVVVFTQWQHMVNIIGKVLHEKHIKYRTFTGNQPDREQQQQEFLDNPDVNVLVATDAGALGRNWQQASVVCHFDLPFNPAKVQQREDRVHRMNQKGTVMVYQIVARNTIEDVVTKILREKSNLFESIVENTAEDMEMNLNSIKELLEQEKQKEETE